MTISLGVTPGRDALAFAEPHHPEPALLALFNSKGDARGPRGRRFFCKKFLWAFKRWNEKRYVPL